MLKLVALRRRLRDERGFTMIELLVGMSVGMIVLFALYNLLDSVAPATTRVQDRVDAQSRGRAGMEQMGQLLRTTVCVQYGKDVDDNAQFWTPYSYADDNRITFYTNTIDAAHGGDVASGQFEPQRRTLAYAAGTITETMEQGTPVTGTAPPTFTTQYTRTVVSNVQPITGRPIFTYKRYSGAPAALTKINPADDGTGTIRVLDAELADISSVDIAFRVVPTNGRNTQSGASFEDTINARPSIDLSNDDTARLGVQCQI